MNKSRVIIIDFDDSFTWNIVNECNRLIKQYNKNIHVEVSHWRDFKDNKLENELKQVIIWGPGPGVPDNYKQIYPILSKCLQRRNIFNLGICLGHQMILMRMGHRLVRAKRAKHGENIKIVIPHHDNIPFSSRGQVVDVQLYNSWVIKEKKDNDQDISYIKSDGEIMGHFTDKTIGYQFHPESIGTSCKEVFFLPILKYLYNE